MTGDSRETLPRVAHVYLVAPLAVVLLAVFAYPTASLLLSGFRTTPDHTVPFAAVFADPLFRAGLLNTVALACLAVPTEFVIGTVAGYFIGRARACPQLCALLCVPLLISPAVVALVWRVLLDPLGGLPRQVAEVFGMATFDWTGSSRSAFFVVAAVDIWQWTPMVTLLVAAATYRSDRRLFSLARLDGLSPFHVAIQVFGRGHARLLLFVLLLRLADCLRTFEIAHVLTRGGPGTATELVSLYIYRNSFVHFNESLAGGAALLLILLAHLMGLLLYLTARISKTHR